MIINKKHMDKYFLANSDVNDLIDFLNEKMITDIKVNVSIDKVVMGIKYYYIDFEIDTLHMGYGIIKKHHYIKGFQEFNTYSLINTILWHFEGVTGITEKLHA